MISLAGVAGSRPLGNLYAEATVAEMPPAFSDAARQIVAKRISPAISREAAP
jgi:hypothetical protein